MIEKTPNENDWQKLTIAHFLESAVAWTEDSEFGKRQNIKDNMWYKFASFLYCGKIYE